MKIIIVLLTVLILVGCKKEVEVEKSYALSLSFSSENKLYIFDKHDEATYSNRARFGAYKALAFFPELLDFRSTFSEHTLDGVDIRFSFRQTKDSVLLDTAYRRYRNYDDFKKLFTLGTHPFADAWNQSGLSITYIKNNELWVTERIYWNNVPIATHSNFYNSSFEITAVEKFFYEKQSEDAVRVFANFEVTLYNQAGDSLQLEDGSFVMLFSQGNN